MHMYICVYVYVRLLADGIFILAFALCNPHLSGTDQIIKWEKKKNKNFHYNEIKDLIHFGVCWATTITWKLQNK